MRMHLISKPNACACNLPQPAPRSASGKGKLLPNRPRSRIFGSIGNVTTAERTLSVAPFLKALFKLYKMGHGFASAIW